MPKKSENIKDKRPSDVALEQKLQAHLDLVRKWNRVAGLVSSGDLRHLRTRHMDDSLSLDPYLKDSKQHLDIGSGGGFPGIPLAVCNPSVAMTLVDRNRKKCNFLRHVAMTLSLNNVVVEEVDAKSLNHNGRKYDTITARAVARPEEVWNWVRELLAEHGRLLIQQMQEQAIAVDGGVQVSQRKAGVGFVIELQRVDR